MSSTGFHSMDLFSGLGGNAYAFRGFATPQLYCEILPSARLILKSAMLQGHIPTAPIHADVTTLMRSEVYRTAKEKRPMLISGSWPCQGNSTMGKRKGMADPRSGLIRELCDIYEDARPDIFFCENTPSVVDNGQLAYLRERLGKMYSISWGTFTAEDCGFPHVRRRFFAVGVLKGQSVALPAAEPLSRLLPAGEEPPRMTLEPQFGRVARLHALGNSVVPAAILHGFHTLLKMDVPEPRPARPLRLEIAAHFYTPPEGVTPSKLFNSDGLVVDAVRKTRWSTPRAGMHGACHVLTERSIRDLPTMLRFERGTPDELRGGQMSVSWNEWLMGYPVGYTAVTDPALMEELETAPRESRGYPRRKPRSRVHHDDDDLPKRKRCASDDDFEVVVSEKLSGEAASIARSARVAARRQYNIGQPSCGSVVNDIPTCNALGDLYYATGGSKWTFNAGWAAAAAGTPTDYCTGLNEDGFLIGHDNNKTEFYQYSLSPVPTKTDVNRLPIIVYSTTSEFSLSPVPRHGGAYEAYRLNNEISKLGTHVGCNQAGHITKLFIPFNNLVGTIPEIFCQNLPFLSQLTLHGNNIEALPSSMGSLTSLTSLNIGMNTFLGPLPASMGNLSNLRELYLAYTSVGSLPSTFGSLASLTALDLFAAGFPGELIGSLSNLTFLNVANEGLTSLPESFSQLTNLRVLDVSANMLTTLPTDFIQQLQNVSIQNNLFIGAFPPKLFGQNIDKMYASSSGFCVPSDQYYQYKDVIQDIKDLPLCPPPPPPPEGMWANINGAESQAKTITMGLPYATYKNDLAASAAAFAYAIGPLMGAAPADVVVSGAEQQGANATVVHFKVLSPLGNAEALYGRLNNSGVTSALQGVWPSIVHASLGDALPAPPPPIGTYTVLTQGQTIAFDTPMTVWQTNMTDAYTAAVVAAVAEMLEVHVSQIQDVAVRPAINGGTIIGFSIFTSEAVSDAIDTSGGGHELQPHFKLAFAKLFGKGDGSADSGAPAIQALVAALQKQGLPVSTAYYDDQPAQN